MPVSRRSSLEVSCPDHSVSPFMDFVPDAPSDFYYECNWTLFSNEFALETFDFDWEGVPVSYCYCHLRLAPWLRFVSDFGFVCLSYCPPDLVCCSYASRFSLTLWHLRQYWHGLAQYQIRLRFHHLYYQTHPVLPRTLRIIGTSRQLSVPISADSVGDHGLFLTLSNSAFSSVLSWCLRGSHSNLSLSCFLWHYPTDFLRWSWYSLSGFACQQMHSYSNWAATADQKCCLCCLMLCCFWRLVGFLIFCCFSFSSSSFSGPWRIRLRDFIMKFLRCLSFHFSAGPWNQALCEKASAENRRVDPRHVPWHSSPGTHLMSEICLFWCCSTYTFLHGLPEWYKATGLCDNGSFINRCLRNLDGNLCIWRFIIASRWVEILFSTWSSSSYLWNVWNLWDQNAYPYCVIRPFTHWSPRILWLLGTSAIYSEMK